MTADEARAYWRNHYRVNRVRGRAADQQCGHCGGQARDWAHIHDQDPGDPAGYMPLCKPCHVAYDGSQPPVRVGGNPDLGSTRAAQQRAKESCPQGHEYTEDNIYWREGKTGPTRNCKRCARERSAARYAASRRSSSPANV